MSAKNNTTDKTETVQALLARLDALTAWFESDDFELEQAVEKYKEAEAISRQIEARLTKLKHEITILQQDQAD